MADDAFYGELLAALHAEGYQDHSLAAAAKLGELLSGAEPRVVVDLGCGSGDLLASFAGPGVSLLGVDRSPRLLAYATQRAPSARLLASSIYDATLPERIDLLCAVGEVVQYGPDPRAGLEGLRWLCELGSERLAPGGLLAFDLVCPGRAGPTGERRLERQHGTLSVVVESVERGRALTRRITTTQDGRAEVETHRQVTVTPEEAVAEVERAGLQLRYLAAGYAGEAMDDASSSVAIIAAQS